MDKGTRPEFVFPISIIMDDETIQIDSEEALNELVGNKRHGHRPPFELVFPVSVNTEDGEQEFADEETFKAYRESLDKGTRPEFVFPISIIMNDETLEVESEEALKELVGKKKRRRRS